MNNTSAWRIKEGTSIIPLSIHQEREGPFVGLRDGERLGIYSVEPRVALTRMWCVTEIEQMWPAGGDIETFCTVYIAVRLPKLVDGHIIGFAVHRNDLDPLSDDEVMEIEALRRKEADLATFNKMVGETWGESDSNDLAKLTRDMLKYNQAPASSKQSSSVSTSFWKNIKHNVFKGKTPPPTQQQSRQIIPPRKK
jgi:hypothetical protein